MNIFVAGEVRWIAYPSSGSRIAIHDDKGVTVYEYSNGNIVFRLTELRVVKCAYSPDSRFLACQGYKDAKDVPNNVESLVQIWDITRNKQICCIDFPECLDFGGLSCLKFSPDSMQLAIVRDDGLVSIIKVATGQVVQIESPSKRFYSSSPSCVFYPDSEALVYTHLDEAIKIADLNTGRSMLTLKPDKQLGAFQCNELIGFRPADQKLLVAYRGKDDYHNRIDALDAQNGVRVPFISGRKSDYKWDLWSVVLSPGGEYLAATVVKEVRPFLITQLSYAVIVWDAQTGKVISETTIDKSITKGFVLSVYSLEFDPDGNLLVGRKDSIQELPRSWFSYTASNRVYSLLPWSRNQSRQ